MNDRDYAVVVGINHYQDHDDFGDLNGPTNDAEEMVAWLKDPNGGALPSENVDPYVLLASPNRDKPTASDIATRLRMILSSKRPRGAPVGRRLYIFLAGHGFAPAMTLSLLHSVETSRDVPAFVSGTQWVECFHSNAVFEELVLWMDCCRDFDPNVDPPQRPCRVRFDPASSAVKQLYLLATGFGQGAFEQDFDGKVHGLFSRALLEALRDDAIDGDGRMTAANVANAVRAKLAPAAASNLNIFPDPLVTPNFVLFEGLPRRFTRVEVTPTAPDTTIRIFAGDDVELQRPIEPVSATGGMVRFELPRGKTYTFLGTDPVGRTVRQWSTVVEVVPLQLRI